MTDAYHSGLVLGRSPRQLPRIRRAGHCVVVAGLIWIAVILFGGKRLLDYARRGDEAGAAPSAWPGDSLLAAPQGRSMLLMFLHPKCPCSRSSLANLARLMSHCHDHLDACIVLVLPPGAPDHWADAGLGQRGIPGVRHWTDLDGREAKRFDARTSGQTLVYDAAGRLVFCGGITPARGHEGDCVGATAIRDLVLRGTASHHWTPVFGCPLFDRARRSTECLACRT